MSQLLLPKLLAGLQGMQGQGFPLHPPGISSLFSSHEAWAGLTPTKTGSGMNGVYPSQFKPKRVNSGPHGLSRKGKISNCGELPMPSCTDRPAPVRRVSTKETAELKDGSTDENVRPSRVQNQPSWKVRELGESLQLVTLRFLPDSHS